MAVSCLVLERSGRWRGAILAALVLLLASPYLPLLARGLLGSGGDLTSFWTPLLHSAVIAVWTAGMSLVIGLPCGVATALYDYPLRRLLLALALLPALVPPFLLSIGWSYLFPPAGGLIMCAIVFSSAFAPLVLLTSYAAARSLPHSLVDIERLSGGEGALVRAALRYARLPSILMAGFAGVLTLSDPGPGQVFGVRTAASELLVSLAVQYDLDIAARQSLVLVTVVLIASVPLVWFAAPGMCAAFSARMRGDTPPRRVAPWMWMSAMPLAVMMILLGTPLAGLVAPLAPHRWATLANQPHVELVAFWALDAVMRTIVSTFLYALGAAAVGLVVALLWTFAVGRERRLLTLSTAALLTLLALPSAISALGLVRVVASAPGWADALTRGRFFVCVAFGLRLAPFATLLLLRGYGAMPRSRTLAAALHGVPLPRYFAQVLLPTLLPSILAAALVVAILSGADVTTILLLHPPGDPSLSLAIFTVMANAPEHIVATLCLLYVGLAAAALGGLWSLASRALSV